MFIASCPLPIPIAYCLLPIAHCLLPIAEVNGKPAVFIKDRAEQYSISYVNKGTSNSKIVNIIKGVEEGERVVTNGVYQMKTMFLNQ